MKKIFLIFTLFILFILFTFIKAYSYSETISLSLEKKLLRLHIIANSNSSSDQIFKLKCRDEIMKYLQKNINYNQVSKQDIISFISSNIDTLYNICYDLSKKENINTDFKIYLSNSFFPTKQYGNILIPAGNYDSLKIEIGSSNGNNWWCSLFPPLCFSENSITPNIDYSQNTTIPLITSNLTDEETNLLINSYTHRDISLKFKIIEAFNTKIK